MSNASLLPKIFLRWEIHYACNYRCSYCYFFRKWHHFAKKNYYPPLNKWEEAFEKIFKRYGSSHIHITGGEPFVYPKFFELVCYLNEKYTLGFDTNLFFDASVFIRKIKYPQKIQLCPAFHPEFAGIKNFIEKLKILKEAGVYIGSINYVAYPPYLKYITVYKEEIEKNGFEINIMPFRGEYKGQKYPQDYTEEDKKFIKNSSGNYTNSEPTQGMLKWYESDKKGRKGKICRMGQRYAKIFPDGTAYRCCMVSEEYGKLGNLLNGNFSLLNNPKKCLNDKCNCWAAMIIGEEDRWFSHWIFQSMIKKEKKNIEERKELSEKEKAVIIDELLSLAKKYIDRQEYALAIKEMQNALTVSPDKGRIHAELGWVYEKMKDYDMAIKELTKAIREGYNKCDDVYIALGRIYCEHRQEYALAIKEMQNALTVSPDKGRIHAELGWVYEKMKDYDMAIKELTKAIREGYDTEENRCSLGRMFREKEEFDFSIKEFEKAIQISPNKNESYFKNKILNEIEISQRKVVLGSKPRGILVCLTSRCNLRCIMCHVWKHNNDVPEKTVKEILNYLPYLELLVLQGGEVFLSKYFEEIFEEASNYPRLRQQIVTNGLLINEKWAKKLARNNIEVVFSIDGITKKTYEYIRKGAKFELLLDCINLINEYKEQFNNSIPYNLSNQRMRTAINLVIMKSNYRELNSFIEFAKENKFEKLVIAPIEDNTTEENIFLHNDPETLDYLRKTIQEILRNAKEYKIEILNLLPFNNSFKKVVDFVSLDSPTISKKRRLLCNWPWQFLIIDQDGNVRPQCLCRKFVGNINKNSLDEIWNSELMQSYRKKIIENNYENLCDSRCVSGSIFKESLGFLYV